ncbi:MAG: glycosyltransferase [Planctomycetota bacterium]
MRIGFDVSELNGEPGGVSTSIRLILEALHKDAPEVEVVALAPRPVAVPQGIRMEATGGPARPRSWRRSLALRDAAEGFDVFHSPVLAHPDLEHVPVTVTLHELPFVVSAKLEGNRVALAQWRWLSLAMQRCRAIVVPSHATEEQLRLVHPGALRITRVIPHPAPYVDEMQHDHDGSLLFVGRIDRRKSVEALLAGCAEAEGKVLLVGPHDKKRRERISDVIERHGLGSRVELVGEVDDKMRNFLYRQAGVVALVSRSEGFGFPVLEALGRGVPVMVAHGTGAAEIGGDAVITVDPRRPGEIANGWRRALETEHRAFVRTHGPARLLRYRPVDAARAYVELWNHAIAR